MAVADGVDDAVEGCVVLIEVVTVVVAVELAVVVGEEVTEEDALEVGVVVAVVREHCENCPFATTRKSSSSKASWSVHNAKLPKRSAPLPPEHPAFGTDRNVASPTPARTG